MLTLYSLGKVFYSLFFDLLLSRVVLLSFGFLESSLFLKELELQCNYYLDKSSSF